VSVAIVLFVVIFRCCCCCGGGGGGGGVLGICVGVDVDRKWQDG
jgi:hypothetical protein